MSPIEVAILSVIAAGLPILGFGALIIKWQLDLDRDQRRPKPDIKPAE